MVLWLTKGISTGRKLFASLVILLYTPVYVVAIIIILWKFFGLQYEFRGSGVPALTWRKTLPDYDKLRASREAQRKSTAAITNTGAGHWTGFRGPSRDGHYNEQSTIAD